MRRDVVEVEEFNRVRRDVVEVVEFNRVRGDVVGIEEIKRMRQDVVEVGAETDIALQLNRLLNYKNEVAFCSHL